MVSITFTIKAQFYTEFSYSQVEMKVIIFPQKDHDDFENKGYLVSGISSVDWKSILDQCTYGSRGSVCQRSGKTH